MKYSNKEIIHNIRKGNKEKVLQFVYQNFYPKVFRILKNKNAPEEDIKDVFQDSVLILIKRILENGYGDDTNVGGFLTRVGTQLWIDKVRKDKKLSFDNTKLTQDYTTHDFDMVQKVNKNKVLDGLLESIGEKCAELIKKVYFSGYDMTEIAAYFEFSNEDSAKTQHYRCKQKLIKKYRNNTYLKEILLGDK